MEVKVLQQELEEASKTLQTLSSGESERQTLVEEMDVAQTLELLRSEKKRKIEEEPVTIQTSPVSSPPQEMKNKPKKKRRKRDEIERNFRCTVSGCTKSYGSEGALKTHIKLKHHDIPIAIANAAKTQATIHNRGDRAWAPVAIKAPSIGLPTVPDVPPATVLPPLQQQTACPALTLPPISALTNGTPPQRVALPNTQRYDFSIFPLAKDNSLFKGVKIV